MSDHNKTIDFFKKALSAINVVEQPITYQDYINNKETTTEAEDIINEMGDEETELLSGVRDEDNILIVQRGYNADDIDEDPRVIGELYASEKYSEDDIKKAIVDYLKSKNLDTNFYYDSTPNDYYSNEKTVDGRPFRAEVSLHWLGDMGESVEEDDDEYDQPASRPEAEMVDNQIAFIKYAVDEIEDNVKAGGEFPEWFQNKLSGVHEIIKMLHAYMEGERRSDDQSEQVKEKAVSKAQQQAAGAALAAKQGDAPKSKLQGASKEMMKMSTKELEKFAGTKHKGLPKKKESIGESTMTDTNKEKLNEGIRIQTDSLEDSIALMTILKNAGLDPQQMNIQQSPSMNAPAPDMTPDLPAEIPGEDPKDVPMDEPEAEAFDNAPDEKMLDKDDYELKRNKVPNSKMGSASAKQGDNPLEAIEEIAKQLNKEYNLFKEGRVKDWMLDMEADAADMSKEEFVKAHGEKYAYVWDRVHDEMMEGKKSKPDYLDFDKDGDKKEPMKKALADKKKK